MNTTEKYKQFRNYMTNELGITRQDIEAWTKQAVTDEVCKRLSGVDIEKIIKDNSREIASQSVCGYHGISDIRKEIAKELVNKITVTVSQS